MRRYLLGQTQNSFWNNKEDQTQRATGLRPPGSNGSLSLKDLDQHLVEFCPLKKPTSLPLTFEVLVADTEVNRPLVKDMIAALESSGIKILKKVVLKKDFYSEMQIGDFDLAVTALGASEPDPDSAWRIFKNDFPKDAVSDEYLHAAQVERDASRRDTMYQEIERRVLKNAYFIPIKNEYTYILTDRSIELDLKQAAEWGLQLYKLNLKSGL